MELGRMTRVARSKTMVDRRCSQRIKREFGSFPVGNFSCTRSLRSKSSSDSNKGGGKLEYRKAPHRVFPLDDLQQVMQLRAGTTRAKERNFV